MKNLNHGEKKKLANWLGMKKPYLSRVLSLGFRGPRYRAKELEKISGISYRDWMCLPANELTEKMFEIWEGRKNEISDKE